MTVAAITLFAAAPRSLGSHRRQDSAPLRYKNNGRFLTL